MKAQVEIARDAFDVVALVVSILFLCFSRGLQRWLLSAAFMAIARPGWKKF